MRIIELKVAAAAGVQKKKTISVVGSSSSASPSPARKIQKVRRRIRSRRIGKKEKGKILLTDFSERERGQKKGKGRK